MVHDAGPARGRLARLRRRFPGAAAVVFGHSHLPLHERDADGFQIFNPGSPTERRRAPTHTMGIARVEASAVSFELVDLDGARA
jgi:predicted phosphodiesterase